MPQRPIPIFLLSSSIDWFCALKAERSELQSETPDGDLYGSEGPLEAKHWAKIFCWASNHVFKTSKHFKNTWTPRFTRTVLNVSTKTCRHWHSHISHLCASIDHCRSFMEIQEPQRSTYLVLHSTHQDWGPSNHSNWGTSYTAVNRTSTLQWKFKSFFLRDPSQGLATGVPCKRNSSGVCYAEFQTEITPDSIFMVALLQCKWELLSVPSWKTQLGCNLRLKVNTDLLIWRNSDAQCTVLRCQRDVSPQ